MTLKTSEYDPVPSLLTIVKSSKFDILKFILLTIYNSNQYKMEIKDF